MVPQPTALGKALTRELLDSDGVRDPSSCLSEHLWDPSVQWFWRMGATASRAREGATLALKGLGDIQGGVPCLSALSAPSMTAPCWPCTGPWASMTGTPHHTLPASVSSSGAVSRTQKTKKMEGEDRVVAGELGRTALRRGECTCLRLVERSPVF